MTRSKPDHTPQTGGIDPETLHLLIEHGQRKGYLGQRDLVTLVPDVEYDDEMQEQLLEAIEEAGIAFREQDSEDETPGEDLETKELESEQITAPESDVELNDLEEIETGDMLRLYVREASRTALLTAEEELELARQIEQWRFAQEELSQGGIHPEQARELEKAVEVGKAARERLIRANARLVISIARHYLSRGLPFLDLIQEGNVGLMRAIRNFDYHRGFKFSTYATWWIRQSITRALAEQSRTIRLPVHVSEQISKMRREQHRLQQQFGRAPTAEELAEALGLPPERIIQMEEMLMQPLSLQAPVGDDEEESLGNLIEDVEAPDPEETTLELIAGEDLRERVATLPPREKQVLEFRYGLTGEAPMTLSEVGQKMGITRERARQLESQALKRLRKPPKK